MPYLEQGVRSSLDSGRLSTKPGELNYELSRLVDGYITRHGLGYGAINDVIGALECCKLEVYRRIAAPYEDIKSRDNGEVFLNAK
jgi:hypothetical protein